MKLTLEYYERWRCDEIRLKLKINTWNNLYKTLMTRNYDAIGMKWERDKDFCARALELISNKDELIRIGEEMYKKYCEDTEIKDEDKKLEKELMKAIKEFNNSNIKITK